MAVDMISMLPDEVLHHILSFLPTQMAAATTILSKRWKPLWLSGVSTLFFDDQTYLRNNKPYLCFTKLIYATILDRDLPITTFRLQCRASNLYISDFDLKIWVKSAIKRGLENLYIQLSRVRLSLTSSIFCCKTLVVLNLVLLEVAGFDSVHLPSLKTLHLKKVVFPDPQCLADLLVGCPILEYMRLRSISYDNVDNDIPSNKNFGSLSKLVRADIHDIAFDIFVGYLGIDKDLDGILVFPNLTHVELNWGIDDMEWHLVLAMLNQCPILQYFVLDMLPISDYDYVDWITPGVVPECLCSQLRQCSITNYEGTETELHFAKYIMQNSRVLRTMTICTRRSSVLKVDKLKLQKELSSCPRSSTICELSFK